MDRAEMLATRERYRIELDQHGDDPPTDLLSDFVEFMLRHYDASPDISPALSLSHPSSPVTITGPFGLV